MNKVFYLLIALLITGHAFGQDSASVQLIVRPLPDKILLRWAVDQPLAWKKANSYGFWVERTTISKNGAAVLPLQKIRLNTTPIKPAPLEQWETLATTDQNAAVVAQALYGDTFETTAPTDGAMAEIFAVNAELEQRFTFALLAAEQNYEAAKQAGWGFEDTQTVAGEAYLYTVKVAVPDEANLTVKEAGVYASTDLAEDLPKPIGLAATFNDGQVALSWNFNILQDTYTSYLVERSRNNQSFEQLNGAPIFNAQEPTNARDISLFFNDSIPNGQTFYYRVKGKTAFGEVGPPSDVIEGQAQEQLGIVPRISLKTLPTDNTVILNWEFDEKGNGLIDGFELRRANKVQGPFETVQRNLPPTARRTEYSGLQRVNYFTIAAMGKNGVESESYPSLVQPVDSIPPAAPLALEGTIDTLGVVRLRWKANTELDLGGYRVFRANNAQDEFSQITKTALVETTFIDSISVKNLNRNIHYKIKAEDQRYNQSEFSAVLTLKKPDLSPPSPAVLSGYELTEEGVTLRWIPSSSNDVTTHLIYRKPLVVESDVLWQAIHEQQNNGETTFTDTGVANGQAYAYTVVAKDSTGWESSPSNPLEVLVKSKAVDTKALQFTGSANRELRFIKLSWKTKKLQAVEWRLYRGQEGGPVTLYKTLPGSDTSFTDTDLDINTAYVYGLQGVLESGLVSEIQKVEVTY